MSEEWKDIKEFPGYAVSNNGRIKNTVGGQGAVKDGFVTGKTNKGGYSVVTLRREGKTHSTYVHDLVGRAFLNGRKKGFTVNHRNHNRMDNRAGNLEWIEGVVNSSDGRISKDKVGKARAMLRKGFSVNKVATVLKVQPKIVGFIKSKLR